MKPKSGEKRERKQENKKQEGKIQEQRKMNGNVSYRNIIYCIDYMYNVTLNIKASVYVNLDISETAHFLSHKMAFPQH